MVKYGYTKKGFTTLGYDAADLDFYWDSINLQPWRPRLQIYDHEDNTLLLHQYDPFSDNNDLTVEGISCSEQIGTAGTFSFKLWDNERNIDRTKVGNANKVVISIAKRPEGPWFNISSGFTEQLKVQRDVANGLRYTMSGYGSGILIEETIIDLKRTATPLSFGSAQPDPNDPTMKINTLMRSVLNDIYHLVSAPTSIQQRGNFDLSLISQDLDTFVPLISVRDQPAAQALNFLSERSGSIWGVNAYDQVWAWYPSSVHSGVTLKTFKQNEKATDKITQVSYFFGPWDYTIPIDQDSFGNVLIANAGTVPKRGNQSTTIGALNDESGTPLGSNDAIQQISITIPDITQISVLLKKVGNLQAKFINGIIYADDVDRNRPDLNKIVATFQLDISRLQQGVVTPVTSSRISKTGSFVMGTKVWIHLQAVGPQNDDETVLWIHSGDEIVAPENTDLLSGVRAVADTTSDASTLSASATEGPIPFNIPANSVYTFATFYDTRTRVIRKDPLSIARYGQVERFIDVSWTTDFQTISDLLFLMLQTTAYPQMVYSPEKVSIPSPPFQVGKMVNVQDDISGITAGTATMALINSVGYDFNAYDLQWGIGTYFCDLNIGGLYDFMTYEGVATAGTADILGCRPPPLI